MGRKNHYGSRSERGTRVAALFYSLIESAKLCGVEPRGYQMVMFPDDATQRRRIFADAFLARAEAAVEDLEARAALREFADL